VRIWLNKGKGLVMKEDRVKNESGGCSSLGGIVGWESPCEREWIAPRLVRPPISELVLEAEVKGPGLGLGLGLGAGVGDLWR
jgi:hypothetical protein